MCNDCRSNKPGYAEESSKSKRMSVRERLEIRKMQIQETIKYNEEQLAEIEAGLKLLNKNKDIELLVNISQL